jgi:hypothetical protein
MQLKKDATGVKNYKHLAITPKVVMALLVLEDLLMKMERLPLMP